MDWTRLLSRQRLGAITRPARPGRPDFARDSDKIVFCEPFRRLDGKTQVHQHGKDYIRNRLTHSLETGQVGQTLGSLVGTELARRGLLPAGVAASDIADIVRAGALAHDIGTVPFGHSGESTIQDWFRTSPIGRELLAPLDAHHRADLLRFEGNALGFRLLVRGEGERVEDGPHLTMATIAATVKYPGPALTSGGHAAANAGERKFNWFAEDAAIFATIAEELDLTPTGPGAWARHPLVFLVEAADDICYQIVDLEDALRVGYLDYATVDGLYRDVLAYADAAFLADNPLPGPVGVGEAERLAAIRRLRGLCISALAEQAAERFLAAHDAILAGTYAHELIDDLPASPAIGRIKQASRELIYDHPQRTQQLVRGHDTLVGLLNSFGHALADFERAGDPRKVATRTRYLLKSYPDLLRPGDNSYQRTLRMTCMLGAMTDSQAAACASILNGPALVMPPLGTGGEPWNAAYHT